MLIMSWNDFYHPAKEYADYIDERNKNLVSSMIYVTCTEQQVNEGEKGRIMALDEQIEWLEQKVKDSYKSANSCLSNDDVEGCYNFSGDIYKYQSVIDSLKILKKLTELLTCEGANNDR